MICSMEDRHEAHLRTQLLALRPCIQFEGATLQTLGKLEFRVEG